MKTSPQTGSRGPSEHSIRDQILLAANRHFSYYGYGKTTVSDLAKAIGFSKAYIYKFFPSKQAIGEAICHTCLTTLIDTVRQALPHDAPAAEQLRIMFMTLATTTSDMFFREKRLYDIVIFSTEEGWESSQTYRTQVEELLEAILERGRSNDEFEKQTSLAEQCRAINLVMDPFVNPLLLQYKLDGIPQAVNDLIHLILRSLRARSDH